MKKVMALPDLNQATHWINEPLDPSWINGKPLIIHFWSISCGHCLVSLPTLLAAREHFAGRLRMIAVHMPLSAADCDVPSIAAAAATERITGPALIDNNRLLAAAFDNRYVPAYYLFNADHMLYEYHLGERGVDRIIRAADRMLES
ncbi:MAG: TlpA disulfide reductase family protein [Sporolactobacillus sp.]